MKTFNIINRNYVIKKDSILIINELFNYLKNVLRYRGSEQINIKIIDYNRGSIESTICEIVKLDKKESLFKILTHETFEIKKDIILFQALVKGKKLEEIIEKNIQLGFHKLYPIETKNCDIKIDQKKIAKKLDRYNEIAIAALNQSKSNYATKIETVLKFKDAIKYINENYENYEKIILSPYSNVSLKDKLTTTSNHKFLLLSGPEGGLTSEEEKFANDNGFHLVKLGNEILRAENSIFCALSCIKYQFFW